MTWWCPLQASGTLFVGTVITRGLKSKYWFHRSSCNAFWAAVNKTYCEVVWSRENVKTAPIHKDTNLLQLSSSHSNIGGLKAESPRDLIHIRHSLCESEVQLAWLGQKLWHTSLKKEFKRGQIDGLSRITIFSKGFEPYLRNSCIHCLKFFEATNFDWQAGKGSYVGPWALNMYAPVKRDFVHLDLKHKRTSPYIVFMVVSDWFYHTEDVVEKSKTFLFCAVSRFLCLGMSLPPCMRNAFVGWKVVGTESKIKAWGPSSTLLERGDPLTAYFLE